MTTRRQFIQVTRAWYGRSALLPGCTETFNIGSYNDDVGCVGEFEVSWIDLGREAAPRLAAFNDGWRVLAEDFADLLAELPRFDKRAPTPDAFARLLVSLGIEDATPIEPK